MGQLNTGEVFIRFLKGGCEDGSSQNPRSSPPDRRSRKLPHTQFLDEEKAE